ncbi:YheC/YheD family protein [Lentibacillus jeotgali]|uniref:YheC/YheD family protein n=1 Tax=Lentibacillus jeotgali TaxID=558169 RepID=UPI0002626488|nr:YheC/YheD family protein [Lentibacillus jeotgali]
MIVGYMRNIKKPQKFVRLVAKATKYNGIDLVYFTANDVDMERGVINGLMLIENKWVRKEAPVPEFIDINVYCFKHKKVMNFLRARSTLSSGRFAPKDIVNKRVLEDGVFAHLVIPSESITDFKTFHNFLKKHETIIIKPKLGHRGEGIYMLSKNKSDYILTYENQDTKLNKRKLKQFFKNDINHEQYIFQKHINSRTKNGEPFDCRIRLEKNGLNKWQAAAYLIRIGTGQKIVSNVAQGGSVSELTPYLKANYENWEAVRDSLRDIGNKFPYKMEQIFNKKITSMGIDIGIDQDGKPYLFEVNTAPGHEFAMGDIALIKSEHYKYRLTKTKSKGKIQGC